MADFTDLARQYMDARVNRAIQPFTDPTGYMEDRLGIDANAAPTITPTIGNQPPVAVAPIAPVTPEPGTTGANPAVAPPAGPAPSAMNQANQNFVPEQPEAAALRPNQVAAQGQTYNQYTAQQESGPNPNIGYHYPPNAQGQQRSTAYGAYGLTAPAYKDIQAADPYFANRPITSLTKEEQDRANGVYRNVLGQQLQHFGVEPTEENIRGAHLAGARGLADYLKSGAVHPQAAAANGGEENFKNLLQKRMSGELAPASGAASYIQNEVERAHDDNFYQNQQDLKTVANTAFSTDARPATREAANDALESGIQNSIKVKKASQEVDAALADPTGRGALKMMNAISREREEGSILKAIFYKRVGLNDLAKQEEIKLGAGDTYQPLYLQDGRQGWAKVSANGSPIKGWTDQGPMSDDELMQAQLGVKGTTTHTGKMIDSNTGKVYYEQTSPQGVRLVEAGTGNVYRGPSQNLHPYGIGSDLDIQNKKQLQELRNKLSYEPTIAAAKQYYELAAKIDPGDGSEIAKAQQLFHSLGIKLPGGAPAAPGAPSNVTPSGAATRVAPTAAPTAAPEAAAPAAPPVINPADLTRRPGESFASYEKRMTLLQKSQEVPLEVNKSEQTAFIKDKTDFANNASPGAEVANIRRRQTNNLINDPQIMGYLAGGSTASDNFSRILREIITGAYDDKDGAKRLADDWQEAKLPPALLGKVQEYKQSNTRINALTLKSNEGPGSISNIEQRMNQNANMTNIGELTPWAALTGLTQQQLTGDMAVAKQRFVEQHPELNTATAYQGAWGKEQAKIMKSYEGIYQARLKAIKPYYDVAQNPDNSNNPAVQEAYRKATIAAFKTYPTPDYNAETGRWEYKTKEAKEAAMRAILGR